MDAKGEFSIKGLLELASITGLIQFVEGKMKNGKQYVEQVDAKTEDPVYHSQVKPKDKAQILAHTGVWLIEPEHFRRHDPNFKGYTKEVELTMIIWLLKLHLLMPIIPKFNMVRKLTLDEVLNVFH
ncbi:hypothetical protein PPACK8108_LOCUS400 [Phakopsora pachyrhizi]|uniref:Uncharacterized protein n=1 Tax=Phakopsora pachyrhizi TaxID=170000 RepID=A0AAV0AGE0_PHAPC|nr:hypothetical protein PPACK8108_LOCUS400 [Phakopsora pachyrhizi]